MSLTFYKGFDLVLRVFFIPFMSLIFLKHFNLVLSIDGIQIIKRQKNDVKVKLFVTYLSGMTLFTTPFPLYIFVRYQKFSALI